MEIYSHHKYIQLILTHLHTCGTSINELQIFFRRPWKTILWRIFWTSLNHTNLLKIIIMIEKVDIIILIQSIDIAGSLKNEYYDFFISLTLKD